jgi:VanZ family protein
MSHGGSESSSLLTPRSSLRYWLPPILWMAAIFFFSTDNFSGEKTGGLLYRLFHALLPSLTPEGFAPWHFLIRKAAHFTEYAILAMLLFRAFRSGAVTRWEWRWAIGAWSIVAAYALLDEYHQTWTATRVGSIYDSLTDLAGGTAALLMLWLRGRNRPG